MVDVVAASEGLSSHKRLLMSNSIPNIDSLEGISNDGSDEYSTLKKLQRHLESVGGFLDPIRNPAADGAQVYQSAGRIYQG